MFGTAETSILKICCYFFLISYSSGIHQHPVMDCGSVDAITRGMKPDDVKQLRSRLNDGTIMAVCGNMAHWHRVAAAGENAPPPKMSSAHWGYLLQFTDCKNLKCLPAGAGIAVRKEYRSMNKGERERFHNCLIHLKEQKVDGVPKYDLLVQAHSAQLSPGAHAGPSFLPWHREFLNWFELGLRQIDPKCFLPYWDSTMDEGLPNPKDTVMFTADFMGNGDGVVNCGPAGNWTMKSDINGGESEPKPWRLRRSVGAAGGGQYKIDDFKWLSTRDNFTQLTYCYDRYFEMMHALIHIWVGGYMMIAIPAAPNDPLFWLHHCFIDYLWEVFRQYWQTSPRTREYPGDNDAASCGEEMFFGGSKMKPFVLKKVIDGLCDEYTTMYFKYEPRPVCTTDCGGKDSNLFCADKEKDRCLSKVRPGGNCKGLPSNACYKSRCAPHGVCV